MLDCYRLVGSVFFLLVVCPCLYWFTTQAWVTQRVTQRYHEWKELQTITFVYTSRPWWLFRKGFYQLIRPSLSL